MRRNFSAAFAVFVVAVALVMTSACNGFGGAAPSPLKGPHSQMKWEFWLGDPRCVSGCPPPTAQILGQGADGSYSLTTKTDTNHLYELRVNFPEVAHQIKVMIVNEAEERIREPYVWQGISGDKNLGLTTSRPLMTKKMPGTYELTITVEETGPDLPQMVVLRAVLRITLE